MLEQVLDFVALFPDHGMKVVVIIITWSRQCAL